MCIFSYLVEGWRVGRASSLSALVGILGLACQLDLLISQPVRVGVGGSSTTASSSLISIGTVHHMLLRVVTKDAGGLLEAGLHSNGSRKCNTGATASLTSHRSNQTWKIQTLGSTYFILF